MWARNANGHDFHKHKHFERMGEGYHGIVLRFPPLTSYVIFDSLHACDARFAIKSSSQFFKGGMLKSRQNGLPAIARWFNSCKNESNRTVQTKNVESDALRVYLNLLC